MKYFFLFSAWLLGATVLAQTTTARQAVPDLRAPSLQTLDASSPTAQLFTLVVADVEAFRQYLQENKLAATIVDTYAPAQVVVVRAVPRVLLHDILSYVGVRFADRTTRQPQAELSVSGLDLGLNRINLAHRHFPGINGADLVASIKEERFDFTDIDWHNRNVAAPNSPTRTTTHASVMATLLGGGGNTFYKGKGAAWGAALVSTSFGHLLPDTNYNSLKVSVQNHSYGTGIENYYGAEAVAYDASVQDNPGLLHVFSAGNRGNEAGEGGIYKGLNQMANLTGTFKMAKNILTVGSQTLTGEVPLLSSKGPAYDGRVKPELVALGQDGSSGAAAITSGVALLLQQAHFEQVGMPPPAALSKAILINSADEVGTPGIDFQSGYGSVNAYRALQTIYDQRFMWNNIAEGVTKKFYINVPPNARNLKLTLVWSDVPAAPNAAQALVNDLDVALQKDTQIWLPWVLNTFPHPDSLRQAPVRRADHLNNVEQITLEQPAAGEYEILVKGFDLQTLTQEFALTWQWDTLSTVQWTFPTGKDPVEAGETQWLRWSAPPVDATARLEYALDGGDWQLVADSVSLSQPYFAWKAPAVFATAQLRLVFDNQAIVTDTFVITSPPELAVGFDCEQEFSLYWQPLPQAEAYQVYRLGETYLEPLLLTRDTFLLLDKKQHPAHWYAVAPVHRSGREGLRGYTTNYTTQGVGCYLRNFLADKTADGSVQLQLTVGTVSGLKTIAFEKATRTGFVELQNFNNLNQLDFEAIDNNAQPGVNTYRAVLTLQNGVQVYSDPAAVYVAGASGYWLFPNPVRQGQDLFFLANDLAATEIRVFDALGRLLQRQILSSEVELLPTTAWSSGIYLVSVFKNEQPVQRFKLLVVE